MCRTDIPFAIRLTNLEGWGITTTDFERIIRLDPTGSFIVCLGKKRVGMVTTTSYGKEMAWIGNVVVKEVARGRHIGQRLVEHAVAYLRGSGIRKIALYCMWKNVRFYEKLGFVRDVRFVRLHRKAQYRYDSKRDRDFGNSSLLTSMLAVDKKAFGADRSKLLRLLLTDDRHGVIFDSNNRSFLVVKTYSEMSEFGPWVGTTSFDDNDGKLIKHITNRYGRKPIEASCLVSNRKVLNVLKRDGFRVTNVGYRMCYARKQRIGCDQVNFLLGFLDKG
jgi:N-acetylglutamate synthase-like GNAT family acetyltransferase